MTELLLFSTSAATILFSGFFIGLWHAREADHLAAVSTIVSEHKNLWNAAVVGGLWGLGHTISLMLVGVFVLFLDFKLTEQTAVILEFCVGLMLVLLGLNVLRKIIQGGTLHTHAHHHGARTHVHPHLHEADKNDEPNSHHGLSYSPRALIVGMVHGLAGSAALMLAILTTIESRALGLFYIAIFGVGSIGGMVIMSFLVGLPFHFMTTRLNLFNRVLQSVAGLVSVFLGLYIMYEKGVVEGLFA